ncbi:MAG: methyltransferase domain-containing protein [Polyangiaceae bacterium]|nr:methyltransferase domain-containing protein [Polyangiaceae bacterium]
MGTPWDRAAARYLEEWVPRFMPYHLDLVRDLSLSQGQRVLVTMAGPGAEMLAVARAVGDKGKVLATDTSVEMIRICQEQIEKARFDRVMCMQADASDTGNGDWNAIVCAFGLRHFEDRELLFKSWRSALVGSGKVGVLVWGPSGRGDPFDLLTSALAEFAPNALEGRARIDPARDSMRRMFEQGGLSLVRHTVIRHTVNFTSAESFLSALSEGCTWRKISEELGAQRMARIAARFFDQVGGLTVPLTFQPAATLAIAAIPGASVTIGGRGMTAPQLSQAQVAEPAPRELNEHDQWVQKISRVEPWDDNPPDDGPKKS